MVHATRYQNRPRRDDTILLQPDPSVNGALPDKNDRLSRLSRRSRVPRRRRVGTLPAASFDHRAHVRLAYLKLAEQNVDAALVSFRETLQAFMRAHGIDPGKYHETITVAWLLAVRHFMDGAGSCASADEFIERCPRLLDTSIMMTHYSPSHLFSAEAKAGFVEPDLAPIPSGAKATQGVVGRWQRWDRRGVVRHQPARDGPRASAGDSVGRRVVDRAMVGKFAGGLNGQLERSDHGDFTR